MEYNEYDVYFIHSRSEWGTGFFDEAWAKNFIEKVFVATRERAVIELNKMYETWNKEYDENATGIDYVEYIRTKQNDFLKANKLDCLPIENARLSMRIYSDEEADIVGYSEIYNDTISARLKLKENP